MLVALTVLVLTAYDHRVELVIWIACLLLFGLAARAAVRADRRRRPPPTRRPRPGTACSSSTRAPATARRPGSVSPRRRPAAALHTVELEPGENLRELAEKAIAAAPTWSAWPAGTVPRRRGRAVASARGVAHVCIPSGTRNHFAQDLGLDRDDPVGALDAFGAGSSGGSTWPP